MERLVDGAQSLLVTLIVSVAGGVMWLVRRVLTNQKQIELLRLEIDNRDKLRKADSEKIDEVRKDVRELRSVVIRDL